MRRWLAGVLTSSIIISLAPSAPAADARRASLTRVDAGTLVRMGGRGQWRPARTGMLLGTGDEIRTARGVAELTYGDGTVTRLGPNSTLGLKDQQTRGLRLWFGRLWMKVAKGSGGMRVQTPAAVAAVTGTDLFVFHEQKEGGKHAAKQVIAMAGSFRLAADDNVSTVGLLEGGVRVQPLTTDFNTGMLSRPGKGVWIASLNPQGFRMAQEFGGQDLQPGFKAEVDHNGMNVFQMSPTEIANNSGVMAGMGGPQPGGSGGQGGNNNGGKNTNGKNNDGNGGKNGQGGQGGAGGKSGSGGSGGNGGAGGNGGSGGSGGSGGAGGSGGSGGAGGSGGSGGAGGAGGNGGAGAPGGPGGTGAPGGTEPGGSQPGGSQPGGTQPGGPQPGGPQPGGPQPGGNQPSGPDPNGQPPVQQQPPTPDPTQNTQDRLIQPVDRSPASGELEIIIQ